MKTFLLTLSLFTISVLSAQNRNLPSPTANLVTLPMGSYVIAMDNNLQTNAAGQFNLKTYGLVVHLLNNNVKVKWAIRAGKAKEGIDFQGQADIIQPTYSSSSSRGFRAGPFVIYAEDTAGVADLVNGFYTAQGLSGNDRPKVYRTTVSISNVDIRFDMAGFKPKALILNDGGNQLIHEAYMSKCAITTANYGIGPATTLITKCYTFASEPHHEGPTDAVVNSVRHFVQYGGNFLAQCEAVMTFENHAMGHFQSTNGIIKTNTSIAASATTYPNPDLPYSQFQGVFDIAQGGSVRNWQYPLLSLRANNAHDHSNATPFLSATSIGASVSKLTGSSLLGGMVFYLGNHEFTSITNIVSINGIRMYMNAFLTPVSINSNCSVGAQLPNPLPVQLISFNAALKDDHVSLDWKTATETNTSHFVIERSHDGIDFSEIGMVFTEGNSSDIRAYHFEDRNAVLSSGNLFYRLRTVDIDKKNQYSDVKLIRIQARQQANQFIQLYPNPASSEVRVDIPAEWQQKTVMAEIINLGGTTAKRLMFSFASSTERFDVSNLLKGIYLVRLSCGQEKLTQKLVKL